LRALCVGRHQFLSDHLGLFFRELGLETDGVVGLDGAIAAARRAPPDVVLCDYDLLATAPLDAWERDEVLSRTPVVAVSLTRRPDEGHLLDVNGIAGFLYLPGLSDEEALAVVAGAARRSTYMLRSPFDWQRSTAPRG
jgi:DNA-binding NarL/FixJ family response regulator